MAVYVDDTKDYGESVERLLKYRHWCHMTADSREELDAMALRIGLKTTWRQHTGRWSEHYDLTPYKRELAVRYGATEITTREMFGKKVELKG